MLLTLFIALRDVIVLPSTVLEQLALLPLPFGLHLVRPTGATPQSSRLQERLTLVALEGLLQQL